MFPLQIPIQTTPIYARLVAESLLVVPVLPQFGLES